ncbi:MAG: ATP synthase F1 subunit delta [Actinobacteria bacterium]|nr:ATP synthase F1 subunit delta [Actinomycetota bacterium]MBW3645396.1 ATP synthase F1 subunit delta [Actinomycetota bacterium]
MDEQRVDGYATAMFEVARVEGSLDEVEDELFRFARTLEGNDQLRSVLTDDAVPAERRRGVVGDLLGDRASPVTANLVSLVVGAGRARELPAIIDRLVQRAAAEHDKVVAEVRSAVALDDDQRKRLAEALGRATGKSVEVKVVVDPSVLGGLVARVGDTVIDGTVRTRLDQLRETIR